MKFHNLRIATRLSIAFGSVLTLLAFVVALAGWRLAYIADATDAAMRVPLLKERLVSDWYRYIYAGARRTMAIAKSGDPSLKNFFASDSAFSTRSSYELKDRVEKLLTTAEERTLFIEITAKLKMSVAAQDAIFKAKEAGQYAEAERVLEQEFLPNLVVYQEFIETLLARSSASTWYISNRQVNKRKE